MDTIDNSKLPVIGGTKSVDDTELGRLRQEVMALMEPHIGKPDPPPFTACELVVMAAVCHNGSVRMTQTSIHRDIIKNYPYYGQLAIERFLESQEQHCQHNKDIFSSCFGRIEIPQEVVVGFGGVFGRYDLPLIDNTPGATITPNLTQNRQRMALDPRSARVFLSHLLQDPPEGAFPFLKLPAELRNTIYEMLLVFPKEGIAVSHHDKSLGVTLHAVRRPIDRFEAGDLATHEVTTGSNCRSLFLNEGERGLNLLRVCKQVYGEALPLFLGLKRFHCVRMDGTMGFLVGMRDDRLKHLRHVRLDLSFIQYCDLRRFSRCMDRISETSKHLKCMELVADDKEWIGTRQSSRSALGTTRTIKKCDQIPDFEALAKLCSKAEQLLFAGNSNETKTWIRRQIAKMREDEAVLEAKKIEKERADLKKKMKREITNEQKKKRTPKAARGEVSGRSGGSRAEKP